MSDRLAHLERRLRRLEDERDIARIVASYGPLVDAGCAEHAAALWTAEGSYDVGDWLMNSRDEVAAMVRSDAHQGLIARGSCHFFGPPVVTDDGETTLGKYDSCRLAPGEARSIVNRTNSPASMLVAMPYPPAS